MRHELQMHTGLKSGRTIELFKIERKDMTRFIALCVLCVSIMACNGPTEPSVAIKPDDPHRTTPDRSLDSTACLSVPDLPIAVIPGLWYSLHPRFGDVLLERNVYLDASGQNRYRTSRVTEIRSNGTLVWIRYQNPYGNLPGSYETFSGVFTDDKTISGYTLYNGLLHKSTWRKS